MLINTKYSRGAENAPEFKEGEGALKIPPKFGARGGKLLQLPCVALGMRMSDASRFKIVSFC